METDVSIGHLMHIKDGGQAPPGEWPPRR